MMILHGARLDRLQRILINTSLDNYPAFFYVVPAAVDAALQMVYVDPAHSLQRLENHWARLSPEMERLIRRHGNDFVVTEDMLKPV